MKNFLLALLLFGSTSTFAKTISEYRFAIREGDYRNSTVKVIEASLEDDGLLSAKVTVASGTFSYHPDEVQLPVLYTTQLSEHTLSTLKNNIIALSQAEIISEFQAVVCMMMPGPVQSNDHLSVARDYDFNSDDFLGALELVSGPQGCWVSHRVNPKGGRQQLAASLLKNQIKVIALEAIKN